MVSFVELSSRSLDLWVTGVLKDLQRRRNRTLVGLLITLSRRRSFEAFLQAIIHCRGDSDDPLMVLLLEIYQLSLNQSKPSDASTQKGAARKSVAQRDEGKQTPRRRRRVLPVACVLSRCILAAVTPVLLHVFLSRRKEPIRLQRLSHCFSAIIHDVTGHLKRTGEYVASSGVRCMKSNARSRSNRRRRRQQIGIAMLGHDSLRQSLLRSCSVPTWLSQVNEEEARFTSQVVHRVRAASAEHYANVDNLSGLQEVILAIANSYHFGASNSVPCSLYQLYEQLPTGHAAVKSRVENALVYLQRLRSLDLEHKLSRHQILRDAAREHAIMRKGVDLPVNSNAKGGNATGSPWRKFRSPIMPANMCNSCTMPRRYALISGGASSTPVLEDVPMSKVVGRCLLFCGDYICGFSKVCSAVRHVRRAVTGARNDHLLLLAAAAALRSCPEEAPADGETMNLRPTHIVYYRYLRLIEAVSAAVFFPITPKSLLPSSKQAIGWVTADVISTMNEDSAQTKSTNEGNLEAAASLTGVEQPNANEGDDRGDDHGGDTGATAEKHTEEAKHGGFRDVSMTDMLINRYYMVQTLSAVPERRIFLSEESALCILRAHAAVFKIHFDHLREAFLQIREALMAEYLRTTTADAQLKRDASFAQYVGRMVSGRQSLGVDPPHGFSRLTVHYVLYSYARNVFTQFSVRSVNDMLPRAFWLSNRHMTLLSQRVRGGLGDVYL
ncbi:cullin-associated NEDD8-dissociated protein 1 [Babesia caballi]|uniref:Cullin-associated NEDD8-dissociated protein 1 n=1 Tax=Babesia caballi TaxID=5871 RepID=A0AAV4LWS8_BABCB|nr:cullin-associated NEDD8-dissociated protein 1 [Babesia caballi]